MLEQNNSEEIITEFTVNTEHEVGEIGCPKKIQDLIFPYFCSKSENLCIKTHPDQILGYSEHKSSLIIEVEVLLVCLLVGDFFLIFLAKKIHDVGGISTQFL